MFSTIRKIGSNTVEVQRENLEDKSETHVLNSIDEHFYYFGEGDENTNVLSFQSSINNNLVLNSVEYRIRSYFKSFEKDFFTSLALWTLPKTIDEDSVAEISRSHNESLIKDPPNPGASKNDFRAQENMAYWSAAVSSQQNYHGKTLGIDFIKYFAENVQLKWGNTYPTLDTGTLPSNLLSFLDSVIVPYLVPHKPKEYFEIALEGLCRVGTCYRCTDHEGVDVKFELMKNGTKSKGYIECKYTDSPQTVDEIKVYTARARSDEIPLTIFLTFNLSSQFKSKEKNNLDLTPKQLKEKVKTVVETANSVKIIPRTRRIKEVFNMNAYSIFLEGASLKCTSLFEDDPNPDGIFIIIETNFDVPNN